MALEKAYFAAGCFWGPQHTFAQIEGVQQTQAGYCGGATENPTYQQVCSGATGHSETVEVTFDPAVVSYESLLESFWQMHDPTQVNRQGPDVGTQYRSAIFVTDKNQDSAAREAKDKWDRENNNKAATQIAPASKFYKAEQYHQNYICKQKI